ncbi:DUF58 domain-containing protein [Cesiribacter andamanensis]|uniref:VWFA domain-containing protein n=1 Tax=Cesiribacter andamanensis AMV16 TaxID=1279009 RepID=M7NW45_9BACT|nr:DUF58 domain-containing protein [Cesiribacter andamanensis]EMR02679.1 hypothetical protein ADICEAN_02156 [Cesiribacter andamanensis AMV16]
MEELLKKLRKYEIRIRKAINWQMQGDFHSIFKGSGLEFDDVRSYQYGDDVRIIDWKVSAKGHGTFVKVFREEREQLVYFLVDVSASQELGGTDRPKIEVAKEICGVLALSAVKEAGQVGLIAYSDQNELYIKPAKGLRHAYELITRLFPLVPKSAKTNLSAALLFTLRLLRRRSVVIVLSDFIDTGWEHNLKALARKHDLVALQLGDRRERRIPRLGLIPLLDKESGKTIWVNTSRGGFTRKIEAQYNSNADNLRQLCAKLGADYLYIDTAEDFVPQLISLFKKRNKVKKRA